MFPGLVPMDVDLESEAFNRMYRVHIDRHPAADGIPSLVWRDHGRVPHLALAA